MSEIRVFGLETRSRASPKQFAALLEFMESHGDLTRPQQGPQGRLRADRLWQELVDLLNAVGGGVVKSVDKWKKVWTDWKAKTKKKALIKRVEVCGTGGGPNSRSTITAPEQRVLGIIGLNAVVGNSMIEEAGFDEPLSTSPIILPTPSSAPFIEFPSQNSFAITKGNRNPPAIPPPISFQNTPPRLQVSTPPMNFLISTQTTTAPRGRRVLTSPLPVVSPTASTPRRRRLRRIQTPFERATYKFVDIKNRRLAMEEVRESNNHQREMERLRLDSRRLDMEEVNVQANNRLYGVLTDILTTLRNNNNNNNNNNIRN